MLKKKRYIPTSEVALYLCLLGLVVEIGGEWFD